VHIYGKDNMGLRIQSTMKELKAASSKAVEIAREVCTSYDAFAKMVIDKLHVLSQSDGGGALFETKDLDEIWKNMEELTMSVRESVATLRQSIGDLKLLSSEVEEKYGRQNLRGRVRSWLARHGLIDRIVSAGIGSPATGAGTPNSSTGVELTEQGSDVLNFLGLELSTSLSMAQASLVDFDSHRDLQLADLTSKKGNLTVYITANEAKRTLREWEALMAPN